MYALASRIAMVTNISERDALVKTVAIGGHDLVIIWD